MHNGKYQTVQFKKLQAEKIDRLYGPKKEHLKICENCNNNFVWVGRENTKSYISAKFCSRSCSNSVGGRAKAKKYGISQYYTIASKFYEKKCAVCGEDRVVDVHHIDENRNNNDPSNLIFLCPNHHALWHRNKDIEVKLVIENWGLSDRRSAHCTCNAEGGEHNP